MIYTVTLNPAIDLKFKMNSLKKNDLNRYSDEIISVGGKGINVSLMLALQKTDSTTLGFIGGFTGEQLENEISQKCQTDFVKVKGQTRINIKINSTKETEINGSGPTILDKDFIKLEQKISQIKANSYLVLAGSQANGQKESYKKIGKIAQKQKLNIIADTNNQSLIDILKFKPFLIKPNKAEAEELLGIKIKTKNDIIKTLKDFKKLGAKNILLSLGKKGAYLLFNNKIYFASAPGGKLENSIGAGDSMLAGFLASYLKTNDVKEAFINSLASGSATAFSKNLGSIKLINRLKKEIKIKEYI